MSSEMKDLTGENECASVGVVDLLCMVNLLSMVVAGVKVVGASGYHIPFCGKSQDTIYGRGTAWWHH